MNDDDPRQDRRQKNREKKERKFCRRRILHFKVFYFWTICSHHSSGQGVDFQAGAHQFARDAIRGLDPGCTGDKPTPRVSGALLQPSTWVGGLGVV
jgi:hypothetical protein